MLTVRFDEMGGREWPLDLLPFLKELLDPNGDERDAFCAPSLELVCRFQGRLGTGIGTRPMLAVRLSIGMEASGNMVFLKLCMRPIDGWPKDDTPNDFGDDPGLADAR
jgi:hypothetical protein